MCVIEEVVRTQLQAISIREFGDGLRCGFLEAANVCNLLDALGACFEDLLLIDGVGERSARNLERLAEAPRHSIREKVRVWPDPERWRVADTSLLQCVATRCLRRRRSANGVRDPVGGRPHRGSTAHGRLLHAR